MPILYPLADKSKHSNVDQGRLDDAGFTKLEEREAWSKEGKVVQGGKYYYNRNRWNTDLYERDIDHCQPKVHSGCLHGG